MDTKKMIVRSFVTLHVPCRFSYLRIIRQAVLDLCARAGMSEFKTAQMEMATDEACANIIEHSYGGETAPENEPKHPGLGINLTQGSDRIVVEIIDRGRGFDFNEQQVIEPEDYVEGQNVRGLGMYIIKRFVEEATYERATASGNILRLTKMI